MCFQLRTFERPSPSSDRVKSAILPKFCREKGMPMIRKRMRNQVSHLAIAVAATVATCLSAASQCEAAAGTSEATVQLAQYYPYGPPPGYYGGRPPCNAVNNPWGGAARGAAGGAIIGAIGGNAGAGAAAGAAFGLMRRGIQNSNARANGYCY
jgi:hypothetical protein